MSDVASTSIGGATVLVMLTASCVANTKRSMSLRHHASPRTVGTVGCVIGENAHGAVYSAPLSIQRAIDAISAGVTGSRPSGGMRSSESACVTRARSALADASPGTIARMPDFNFAVAPSKVSSRSPALRASASGPWHAKQRATSTGRTSRAKSTRVAATAALDELAFALDAASPTHNR